MTGAILEKRTSRRSLVSATVAGATGLAFGIPAVHRANATLQVAEGMALVSSPRMPLFGVGGQEAADLLAGAVPTWLEVGSALEIPVEPFALEGVAGGAASPVETFADYESLAAALDERPGGVALIPLDQVDFRVNVLAIDGIDPLRDIPNEADPLVRVGVVGDIVPGRNVGNKMRAYGDYTHPFRKVAAELSSYDVTFANLEGNLSANIAPPDDAHTFSFIASPEMIDGFKLAGIDAVSVANNHSRWNSEGWGEAAFLDTIDSLSAAGVPYFGGGRDLTEARTPWVTEFNGRRIALLGIDGVTANEVPREGAATVYLSAMGESEYAGAGDGVSGTNPYVIDQVLADVTAAAEQYDIVIPYFHFGIEYIGHPAAMGRRGSPRRDRCGRDSGRHQPSSRDPGHGNPCRPPDRLLGRQLHLRPDVQRRNPPGTDPRARIPRQQGGWTAHPRRRDRGLQPAAIDERRRTGQHHGPLLVVDRPPPRTRLSQLQNPGAQLPRPDLPDTRVSKHVSSRRQCASALTGSLQQEIPRLRLRTPLGMTVF